VAVQFQHSEPVCSLSQHSCNAVSHKIGPRSFSDDLHFYLNIES